MRVGRTSYPRSLAEDDGGGLRGRVIASKLEALEGETKNSHHKVPLIVCPTCNLFSPASMKPKSLVVDEASVGGSKLRRKGSATRRDFSDFFVDKAQSSSGSGTVTSTANLMLGQRKRSILKHDSFDSSSASASAASAPSGPDSSVQGHQGRLRGVLKKDSSYDEGLKPILKNVDDSSEIPVGTPLAPAPPSSSSASSSSEDIAANRPFSDVIIDPIPGRRSSEAAAAAALAEDPLPAPPPPVPSTTPHHSRKASLKDRQPVIPPSSVKISSDDRDLADKLQRLALEAEAIRMRQDREREQQLQQQQVEQQLQKSMPPQPPPSKVEQKVAPESSAPRDTSKTESR